MRRQPRGPGSPHPVPGGPDFPERVRGGGHRAVRKGRCHVATVQVRKGLTCPGAVGWRRSAAMWNGPGAAMSSMGPMKWHPVEPPMPGPLWGQVGGGHSCSPLGKSLGGSAPGSQPHKQ
ncbi:unnamed protein product [Eretmochelys imbricata]